MKLPRGTSWEIYKVFASDLSGRVGSGGLRQSETEVGNETFGGGRIRGQDDDCMLPALSYFYSAKDVHVVISVSLRPCVVGTQELCVEYHG